MVSIIDPKSGRRVAEGEPGYLEAKVANQEVTIRELVMAVVDLQHRLSTVDSEQLQWPGDTYEPQYARPYVGG